MPASSCQHLPLDLVDTEMSVADSLRPAGGKTPLRCNGRGVLPLLLLCSSPGSPSWRLGSPAGMTDDMKEARERARKRAAERFHELDRIKKQAACQRFVSAVALPAAVAEKLAQEARPHKIFVSGDARGNFETWAWIGGTDICTPSEKLLSTVQAQAAKVGGAEALLCVGRALPVNEGFEGLIPYLTGEKQVPIETFFIDACPALLQAAPQGRTLCQNLHFLGGYGVKTICGLRVAFLSGDYDAQKYETPGADFVGSAFTANAVSGLRRVVAEDKWKRGIDVLLTSGWPQGLDQRLEDSAKPPEVEGSRWQDAAAPPFAELCAALEPRYHICGTADIFYQRTPFKALRREHACRCIGLGRVGSTSKQRKWLHAFSLSTGACPFAAPAARRAEAEVSASRPEKLAKDHEAGEAALAALTAGDASAFQKALLALKDSQGCAAESVVWMGNVNAEVERPSKKAKTEEELREAPLLAGPSPVSSERDPAEDEEEEDAAEAAAARQQAQDRRFPCKMRCEDVREQENLSKPPKKGIVRYTFRDEGLLGIRLSRDVPPWILEVREGTLSYRKNPRVPVGGVVIAINGYDLSSKENPSAIKALAKRPVVLDVTLYRVSRGFGAYSAKDIEESCSASERIRALRSAPAHPEQKAKAMKRPASTAKLDPLQSYCDQVQEGLESSKVPPVVTKMLSGMVRSALLTSKDKRHKYQASVVQMVTDTIQGVGEDFEQAIADQKSKIANSDTERAEREAAVKGAKEDFDAKKLLTQEKKYALAADAQAFKAAKEGVSKAQAALREADKDLVDRQKAKENVESIVTDLVTPLVQGAVTGDDARRSAENLLSSLKKLALLDESLLTAIPEAITKEPAMRGAFDTSVVSGLQEELERRRVSVTQELAASTPQKEQRKGELSQAEAAFEDAKAKQHIAAEAYTEARAAQSTAEASVKQAQKALSQLDPQVKALQKDLKKLEAELADFYAGPRSALAELSERIEPTEPEEVTEQADA
eukprot:s4086_g3.t1